MITNYELEAYCFWQLSDKKGIGRLGFSWMLLQRCWYIKKSGEGEKFLKKRGGSMIVLVLCLDSEMLPSWYPWTMG